MEQFLRTFSKRGVLEIKFGEFEGGGSWSSFSGRFRRGGFSIKFGEFEGRGVVGAVSPDVFEEGGCRSESYPVRITPHFIILWTPHFLILESTFSILDSTFWLGSTLK